MRETISIATMFLILAAAGIEPGHAHVSKSCKVGVIAQFLTAC